MAWTPRELQKALFTELTGASALTTLLGGSYIYDHVPQEHDFPFVVIGEADLTDRGSHTTEGFTADLTVHSWVRSKGRKDLHLIMEQIDTALHNVSISVSGHNLLTLRREFNNTLVEPDGVTYHGVQTFRALIEQI